MRYENMTIFIQFHSIWRPPILSELTPIIPNMELTNLDSDTPIYDFDNELNKDVIYLRFEI